jgi:ubiquitin-protein ligase
VSTVCPLHDGHVGGTKDELAVKYNTLTRTIVSARKNDLSTWRGYFKTHHGQLYSMEVRLEYRARDDRAFSYPLFPPDVDWQTTIFDPSIVPAREACPSNSL